MSEVISHKLVVLALCASGVAGQTIFDASMDSRRTRNGPPKYVKGVYAKFMLPIVCS